MKIPLIAKVMKNPSILGGIENPSFDICMAALVLDGMCVKYIDPSLFTRREYHSMCEAAVRQNLEAFTKINRERFSSLKWDNFKLFTVRQNGLALRWINEQTPEICLAAVQNNSKALQFVDKSLCSSRCYNLLKKAADEKIKENKIKAKNKKKPKIHPKFLADNQYSELCFYFVKKEHHYINYFEKKYLSGNDWLELCKIAIRKKGEILYFIDISSETNFQELHQLALKNGGGLKYIYKQDYKQCLSVINKNGSELSFIRPNQFTNEQYFNLCKAAVENNGKSLFSVDDEELEQKQYQELCETSVKSFHGNFQFVNNEKIPSNLYHTWCKKALDDNPGWIDDLILHSGIFWVITETSELTNWKLLAFEIPCDRNGNVIEETHIMLNAKSGSTYNHKKLWENEIKNNTAHKPYNKKDYNYYPRGRIDISNNKATIYLNPHINIPEIIDEIKQKFGLLPQNISMVRTVFDGSKHYECFLDWLT